MTLSPTLNDGTILTTTVLTKNNYMNTTVWY